MKFFSLFLIFFSEFWKSSTSYIPSNPNFIMKSMLSSSFCDFEILAIEDSDISKLQTSAANQSDRKVIMLCDVKSGWGNGEHPTTQLCLRFVQDHVKCGDSFLDYGTGSGILSILAAKMGAKKCVAVDIDDESLRAAETNSALNGCAGIIDVVHTRFVYVGEDRFPVCDVTVANILPVRNTFLTVFA